MPTPRLRQDVELIPQLSRGRPTGAVLLRDPRTRAVFEMGEAEHLICQLLDGTTSLSAVAEHLADTLPTPLTDEEVEAFVRQLDFQGLLEEPVTSGMLHYWDAEHALVPVRRYVLANPDRLLGWLHARLWWMFSPAVAVASLGIIGFGAYLLIEHWDQLWQDMTAIWKPQFVLLLWPVGVLGVQLVHELTHGLTATHYGGHVTKAGAMVIFHVLPKVYLERRQVIQIMSRSTFARCYVHLVGLQVQLVLASLGLVGAVLLVTPDGWAYWFWTAVWSTALWGAVHNANIAHRRDAYFAMTTWLRLPDLRRRAVEAMMNWVGRRPQPEPLSRYERRWFILYAFGAAGYYSIHGLLAIWAFGQQTTDAIQGPGLILVGLLLMYLFHRPLLRLLRAPARRVLASQAGFATRWLVRLGWALLVVLILLIPYPYETGGPFTVLPAVQTQVHCEIDGGRIEKVYVREGDAVTVGQPLALIDQREYQKNVQATQAQLDETSAQLALLRKQLVMLTNPPNIEQIHVLEAEARRLETLLADYRRQLELTVLRAPTAARVTTPQIDQKVGQYLKKGDLFATVEQSQAVRVEVQVPEGDVPLVRVGAGVKVVAWAFPSQTFTGQVSEVAPVAAMPTGARVNSVRVVAEIPNPDQRLKSQITGYAKIRTDSMLFGLVLSRLVLRWFQVQFWYWLP